MFVSVPLAARKQRYSVEERRLKRNKRGRRPRNAGRRSELQQYYEAMNKILAGVAQHTTVSHLKFSQGEFAEQLMSLL